MKDHAETEIATTEITRMEIAGTEIVMTGNAPTSGERVWLAPALLRLMGPLLSGLGIELLAAGDRERATIRVEALVTDGPAGLSTERLRIDRVGGGAHDAQDSQGTPDTQDTHDTQETHEAIEFEGPGVWAAASYVVSQAFGLAPPLLTTDAAMFALIRAATRAGQADSPILVTGETGTGKELLVRLIHAASGRTGGMSSVNCAALNDAALLSESNPLSESTLKDASEDAANDAARGAVGTENRLDELCTASDTTLFLDQVSELSPAAQTRVLHTMLRAGDCVAGETRAGARLVSATNRPLGPMVSKGRFKRELYDRLAVLTLRVPPLRERHADIALLAAGFLRQAAPRLSFTAGALKALNSYPFPGNVRELHNLVTRLAILQRDGASRLIHAADVRPQLLGPAISPWIFGSSIWKSSPFRMRREMALQALMVCGGDRVAAARKLGISVRALQQHAVVSAGPAAPRSR
jgi:transcriptional regulator of acetoin/glycerol metabolism